jgi:hypothetical protein
MLAGGETYEIAFIEGLRRARCVLQIKASTDLLKPNHFMKTREKII